MRKHVILLFAMIVAVGLMLAFKKQTNKPADQRPDIIYIMADDMGYSDIG